MDHGCCSEVAENDSPVAALDDSVGEMLNKGSSHRCPQDQSQGQLVDLITLKSLLIPQALERLNSQASYRFCRSSDCPVVYFSTVGDTFTTTDLKVPVFQKNLDQAIPICYCFGWTRQRLQQELEQTGQTLAIAAIMAHIQAGRCGCEVNNPQGSCCLANVRNYVKRRSE